MKERDIYRALRLYNDYTAARRALETGSPEPVIRRVGWRMYGKLTGKLGRKLFG